MLVWYTNLRESQFTTTINTTWTTVTTATTTTTTTGTITTGTITTGTITKGTTTSTVTIAKLKNTVTTKTKKQNELQMHRKQCQAS